ncbi:MAG: hypothetical protein E5X22_32050, partial [Mesorhizobium sp.]
RFAEAASGFRAAELGGRRLEAPQPGDIAAVVLSIREATDRLFRDAIAKRAIAAGHLPDFDAAAGEAFGAGGQEIGQMAGGDRA